jgi:transcriptional regulator with XRE-family HTH domain
MTDDLLAGYLRARRGQLRPGDVGLPHGVGRRRVTGLRREEVALLAGISADYYLRLEQGRGGTPSLQVVHALARALRLDEAASAYVTSLVTQAAIAPGPAEPATGEQVPSTVRNLVDLLGLPAFVTGRNFDVLSANHSASVISPELTAGKNRLRSFFLVEEERNLYCDWEVTAQRFVAIVRDSVGRGAARPDFLTLVEELSCQSEDFRRLWDRHEVVARDTELARLRHPVAGMLQLNLERLNIDGMPGQSLVIYHPLKGTPEVQRLAQLLGT